MFLLHKLIKLRDVSTTIIITIYVEITSLNVINVFQFSCQAFVLRCNKSLLALLTRQTHISCWSFGKHMVAVCLQGGAGCSSVDSVHPFEAVGRRIDPSQWTQLQFGLFSVPTSGPQLVYQRPWYVLFCLWKSAYKGSLAAYWKELPMWRQRVSF